MYLRCGVFVAIQQRCFKAVCCLIEAVIHIAVKLGHVNKSATELYNFCLPLQASLNPAQELNFMLLYCILHIDSICVCN